MNLQEAVQYLMENGYMVSIKGKYKVTAKFNKELTGQETGVQSLSGLPPVVLEKPATDWTQQYIRFIEEAEVPQYGEGGRGSYDLNKYSEKAAKAFRKILERGEAVYPLLVKSTMLYYKTHRRFPVKISRYIEEGLWRTDYAALAESIKEGKLTDHIQKEIDNEKEFSKYRLG